MAKNDPYDILFEPVRIGPVTARNRFYQVPHCCGFGHIKPRGQAAMRAMKAAGGWAVVSTEETEIHPTSDLSPYAEQRIWDDRDLPALRLMTDSVHEHGALAAVELAHNGFHAANLFTRMPSLAPVSMSINTLYPKQARAMDKRDIGNLRLWHRRAIRLAKQAGFDIVYVYAGHHMSTAHHFLNPVYNQRSDEYGGTLENRVRLTLELLNEAREEAAGDCAVAFRFAVDDMAGPDGMQAEEEGRAVVEMLAELPDLWDVNVAGWENDSVTSRFEPGEGAQEAYTSFVKQVTSKPVVGVGRYTSPDHMVALVRKGVLDFIGAARPSISDPFLPEKIRERRFEDIRECIGCNICVSSDSHGVPIRCTQNPTMGEEWRRQWHPELIPPVREPARALVVGAGPAGLECALQLANRNCEVTLAEAGGRLGGRVLSESALPGLSAWKRVRDFRVGKLEQMGNAEIYLESPMDAGTVIELGAPHVFVATGATWRRDGIGRTSRKPLAVDGSMAVLTPDDIFAGRYPSAGPVVIYDDDQCYLAGVIAELLAERTGDVTFITPAGVVSPWTSYTLEQARVQARLVSLEVGILTNRSLSGAADGRVTSSCLFGGNDLAHECAALVLVTERVPDDSLAVSLRGNIAEGGTAIETLQVIGDALAPGLIADAVFSGHLAARDFQRDPDEVERELYLREIPAL